MNKIKWILFSAVVALLGIFVALYAREKKESKRQWNNYIALVQDNAIEQELKEKELREYYSAEVEKIKKLGVKSKQIEHIVETEYHYIDTTIYHDTLIYDTATHNIKFLVSAECTTIAGKIEGNSIEIDSIDHHDSVMVVLYKEKKKCLFKPRTYRALVYSYCQDDTMAVINNIKINGCKK